MFNIGNLVLSIELIIAELIFLFACPRRKWFTLRLIGAIGICLLCSYFFPMPPPVRWDPYYMFFRMVVIYIYTISAMAVCFDLKFVPLVSGCVAGYAVQHIAYQVTAMITHAIGNRAGDPLLEELCIFSGVYFVMFLFFGLFSAKHKSYQNSDWKLLFLDLGIICICIGLTRSTNEAIYHFSSSLYAITCCLLALIMQFNLYQMFFLSNENKAIRFIWEEEKKQYELSKSTIDLINVKYHDLKRRFDSLTGLTEEEVHSLRDVLQQWSSRFKTGNDVLDIILAENSLRYSEEGINFSFMGDGTCLSFMNTSDIYSLFCNAIENAVEAVQKFEDMEKKVICMVLEEKGDLLVISVTNYFEGKMNLQDGLPVTTKTKEQGYHGFGIKSIKLISEKYSGDVKVYIDNDMFTLSAYLMK